MELCERSSCCSAFVLDSFAASMRFLRSFLAFFASACTSCMVVGPSGVRVGPTCGLATPSGTPGLRGKPPIALASCAWMKSSSASQSMSSSSTDPPSSASRASSRTSGTRSGRFSSSTRSIRSLRSRCAPLGWCRTPSSTSCSSTHRVSRACCVRFFASVSFRARSRRSPNVPLFSCGFRRRPIPPSATSHVPLGFAIHPRSKPRAHLFDGFRRVRGSFLLPLARLRHFHLAHACASIDVHATIRPRFVHVEAQLRRTSTIGSRPSFPPSHLSDALGLPHRSARPP
mmetsp:Transcript_10963/g.67818  ORF Transcript_10963/g.67818 Transcript_10963/m.67818 type:complete len:286 (-) Transcript_10963:56-913(-)